jgi:hypothetical protein
MLLSNRAAYIFTKIVGEEGMKETNSRGVGGKDKSAVCITIFRGRRLFIPTLVE